ncbi:MAG: hypothetical protein ACYC5V_13330, partial [Gemmatimonadaceae bacterium]
MPERAVRARIAILIIASLSAACAPVRAQTTPTPAPPSPTAAAPAPRLDARADTVALRRTLDSIANAHRGVVGYSITNLE